MNKNWIKTENLQPKGGFGGKGFFPNLTSGRKNIKKETLGFLFKEQSDVAGSTPARRAKIKWLLRALIFTRPSRGWNFQIFLLTPYYILIK